MENTSINTLTGASESKKKKAVTSPSDEKAFSEAMGDASPEETESGEKSEVAKKKELDKKDAEKAAQRDADRANSKDSASGTKYAKKGVLKASEVAKRALESKNPAELSLSERQAFRLGEFAGDKKPLGGMAQMLAQQGIDTTSFSPAQLKSLMSRMDSKELGQMMSQMKSDPALADDAKAKNMKEQASSTAQQAVNQDVPNFQMESFVAAGSPKEAGESARAEQRRAVMDQILSNIEVRNVANQTEMQLRLNPEYLGEMKITLLHDDEGGINAKFQTTSKLTKEVLMESQEELRDEANEKGVRLGRMDVELVEDFASA